MVERGSRENPHLTGRLEKAAFILLLGPIERLHTSTYRVATEDALESYIVQNRQCECPDFVRHGEGHYWKRRLACGPLARLNGDGNKANDQNRRQAPREAAGGTLTSQATTLFLFAPRPPRGARVMAQSRPPMSRGR